MLRLVQEKLANFVNRLLDRASTSFITKSDAQLWTKISNKAGTVSQGTILNVSGVTRYIKDILMWEISTSPYLGLYIDPKYLDVYVPTDPPPPQDEYVLHVKDGITRKFIPE